MTAALVLLAIGGFILIDGGTIFSLGSLNAQAGEQMLGGVNTHDDLSHSYEACHTPFWGRQIMSDRCLVCHTNISAELKNPASLHGALTEGTFLPCQKCHTEHKGTAAFLTVIDQKRFPHTKATGYDLHAHQKLTNGDPFTCAACYPQNLGEFSQQICKDCHRDDDTVFKQAHINTFGGRFLRRIYQSFTALLWNSRSFATIVSILAKHFRVRDLIDSTSSLSYHSFRKAFESRFP